MQKFEKFPINASLELCFDFKKIENQDHLNFFQDFIYQFVNTSPILYALTAVGLAILIGYFSSFIFKKLKY